MNRTLQLSNILAYILTLVVSYTASAGLLNGVTIGEVSARYPTLVTPADYAFGIWGLIYLMLGGFVAWQAGGLFGGGPHDRDDSLRQVGWWFVISSLANSLWVVCWVYGLTGLSVVMMTLLLASLIKIILNTNMERWDAPLPVIAFLWWPFCFYSGWVTLALITNVAAWLVKLGWAGGGLNPLGWAFVMIILAGLINLLMTWRRNMREFALVGVWGLTAIAVANGPSYPRLAWTAGIVAAVLFLSASVHAYRNRDTSPLVKWQEMRSSDPT